TDYRIQFARQGYFYFGIAVRSAAGSAGQLQLRTAAGNGAADECTEGYAQSQADQHEQISADDGTSFNPARWPSVGAGDDDLYFGGRRVGPAYYHGHRFS